VPANRLQMPTLQPGFIDLTPKVYRLKRLADEPLERRFGGSSYKSQPAGIPWVILECCESRPCP
jgi:hypothetical protein